MATAITVTGKFSPGLTATSLHWQLSEAFEDPSAQMVYDTAPIAVTLVSGAFSSQLVANDDASATPQGTTWTLSGMVDGEYYTKTVTLHHTMAPTVDLSSL